MVDASGNDEQVARLDGDTDPFVRGGLYCNGGQVQYVKDLLISGN